MKEWIEQLFSEPDMLNMGHGQRAADLNLGLGWIYYGLVRSLRPTRAVVIGSWRGFVPLVIGKAIQDNDETGEVLFIDPSLVDDFWMNPDRVARHFERFGVSNIKHSRLTTQEYSRTDEYESLSDIDLLFVDGLHTFEQCRFDFETFAPKLKQEAIVLFHDSTRYFTSKMYGPDKIYEYRVKDFVDLLRKDPANELLDLPVASGVTLMRRRSGVS